MKLLHQMMPRLLAEGRRVLMFSQFKLMLDVLGDYFTAHGHRFLRLDGDTASLERQRLIDKFNKPDSRVFVFLLSTRAGGLGINLTSADTVFIVDGDFNPHNDIQALSRAHRIGQKNNLMIYRLVGRSTVEEKMIEMARQKLLVGHLVVQERKAPKMQASDFNKILRFGAEELFAQDEGPDATAEKVFSEEEVARLLDR